MNKVIIECHSAIEAKWLAEWYHEKGSRVAFSDIDYAVGGYVSTPIDVDLEDCDYVIRTESIDS